MMILRRHILTMLLMLVALGISAQQDEEQRLVQKAKIGLDYSMPDYSVKNIDKSIIGLRLAQILMFLEANYRQDEYNQKLGRLLCQQAGLSEYTKASVSKLRLQLISKKGTDISINYKVSWLVKDKKTSSELTFIFREGLSDNPKVNSLFCEIVPYATAEKQYY